MNNLTNDDNDGDGPSVSVTVQEAKIIYSDCRVFCVGMKVAIHPL